MRPEFSIAEEVRSYALPGDGNRFEALFASVRFEDVGNGRQGAVLVRADEVRGIPIVRTTTRYATPAQVFGPLHEQLSLLIQMAASLPTGFNNALVENYTPAYATMGGHSDQALDLADGSFIAVFSCYQDPPTGKPPRKLLIEAKGGRGREVEVPLAHNSAIVFSVDSNRRFRHRIVLDPASRPAENRWLGVTFRVSKTFVRYRGENAQFEADVSVTLATEEQRREFYRLRKRENNETDFAYPRITYTISESDLMPPERLGN